MKKLTLLIICIFSALILNAQTQSVCFKTPLVSNLISVLGTPKSMVSSDFNSDGLLDFAAVNSGANNINVALATGINVYAASVSYVVGSSPGNIQSADINGDGKPDILLCAAGHLVVLMNNGNGTFGAAINYTTTLGFSHLVDINDDGYLDAKTGIGNSLTFLLGSSNGTFSSSGTQTLSVPTGGTPIYTFADVNGDSHYDIVWGNSSSNILSVIFGNGTGAFPTMTTYTLGPGVRSYAIQTNDFNGDGQTDVAIETWGYITILLGTGSGTLGPPASYITAGGNANDVAISSEDFNGDGYDDIATVNSTNSCVYVFLGTASGNLAPAISYGVHGPPLSVISKDFTGDGKLDLAVGSSYPGFITLVTGLGNGDFSANLSHENLTAQAILSSDFNNDGNEDIAIPISSTHKVSILLGSGNGSFSPGINTPAGTNPSALVVTDFNSDGNKDLAVTNSGSNNVTILLGIGNGSFTAIGNYTVGSYPNSIVASDFNNDGIIDIATSNENSNSVSILLGSGSGTFSASFGYVVGTHPKKIIFSDFNNDTKMDLATVNFNSDNVSILFGSGTGNFSAAVNYTVGYSPLNIATSDFNHDNNADLVVGLAGVSWPVNYIAVMLGNGNGTFAPQTKYYYGALGLNPTDFNNDGNIDLVTLDQNRTATFLMGIGTGSFVVSPIQYLAQSASFVSASDFNNDGLTDAAMMSGNNINIMINETAAVPLSANNNTICIGTGISLNAAGASTYSWSTGATGSSINVSPATTTNYTVNGASLAGCSSNQVITVIVDPACADVWPGDANSDGTADNLDVLELGLHYTQTGPARATTSNSWQSYFSNNWTSTITNGKNLNHSDCNGDGTINDDDTLAIHNNYGLTHAFKSNQQTVTNPQLSIVPNQAVVVKGNWGSASVYLGDVPNPVSDVNGLAFTVNFDNTLIETNSVWIEYPASFINASNQNLHFRKLDFANSSLYTATTHTISNNASGNGLIAKLHYQIKTSLTSDEVLNLGIVQANQSNASGNIVPLTSGTGTLMAMGASVGLNETSLGNLISISPNPAQSTVLIISTTDLEKVEVISLTGQVLLSVPVSEKKHQLNVDGFANGVYFIKAYSSSKQVVLKKLVIQK